MALFNKKVFQTIPDFFKAVWGDYKMIFSGTGRETIEEENHAEHFFYSAVIISLLFGFALAFDLVQLRSWGMIGSGFLGWFLMMVFNWYIEVRRQTKGGKEKNGQWKVPYDPRDIRFGGYGGGWAGFVVYNVVWACRELSW